MAKVYEFLADGFEDIEALAPVDILRRGGVDVKTVSIMATTEVASAHGVTVKADQLFGSAGDLTDADLLLLPGGMPGALHLKRHAGLAELLKAHAAAGKRIGAICAAPMVLGGLGLLQGKRATCYPGFEKYLDGATYTATLVEEDGLITTGEGPAAALPYGYKLLSYFVSADEVAQLEQGMMYSHLMESR